MTRPVYRRKQAGLGMVEIMIAMLIGLLLVGGITGIFESQKQGYLAQEAQSRLQENTRLASIILSTGVAKAGYRMNPEDSENTVFDAANAVLAGTDNNTASDDVLNGSDTLTVRFQRDGVVEDCRGVTDNGTDPNIASLPVGSIAVNTYWVDEDNELQCTNGNSAQPILDNVEDMQILYGEDMNLDGSVDRYVNAANVTNFDNVMSVQIALLLASEGPIRPNPRQITYNLLGNMRTFPQNGTDRIQRRVIERVVALRNRLP